MKSMRSGQSIRNSQLALRALAASYPALDPGTPDGVFGTQTQSAVTAFQRQFDLPETGRLDARTWARLYDEYRAVRLRQLAPAPVIVSWTAPLAAGTENDAVLLTQLMLNRLARTFVNFPALPLSGVFDAATERVVRQFQSVALQPETGTVDHELWRKLTMAFQCAASECH